MQKYLIIFLKDGCNSVLVQYQVNQNIHRMYIVQGLPRKPLKIFFNDVDIQLILEFKTVFRKYYPVFPKNAKGFFGGHAV